VAKLALYSNRSANNRLLNACQLNIFSKETIYTELAQNNLMGNFKAGFAVLAIVAFNMKEMIT
jgi:hypothetical protein